MNPQIPLSVSPNVRAALDENRAVLALESTVLTHGLPFPRNFEVLARLEALCRDNGAEPATIVVLDGNMHIGMDDEDKARLFELTQISARANSHSLHKLSRRDLPLAIANKQSGGTTVSATMLLAYLAGIKVFATGGIGGVHRGWADTMDISYDLKTLSDIPVIVVSAGCKAILDIPATLECLESLGVPVLGWGTDDFPAFYSRSSGLKIDRVDNAKTVAQVFYAMLSLDPHPTGILVANPLPASREIPAHKINKHIETALSEARDKGITGKDLTPFLLTHLAEATKGLSVSANLALLENNVIVGAKIARELI